MCVRLDPQQFAVFGRLHEPRNPQSDPLDWIGDHFEVPLEWHGLIFDWASQEWIAVPVIAIPVAAALAEAGHPVDLLAWVLADWEWAVLVCLLTPVPALAQLLPTPSYLDGVDLCVHGTDEPWFEAVVHILAAVAPAPA